MLAEAGKRRRGERDEFEQEQRRLAEETRRVEMINMFRQLKEEEAERRREEIETRHEIEAERRRDEAERRRTNKLEDDLARDRRDLLQEKLKGLGMYKEGVELSAYLDKYERIMRESEVKEKEWGEWLYPRLPERLCVRLEEARDSKAKYGELKKILLKAVGETAITYGNQLFEVTGEFFKAKSAGEISERLKRIVGGGGGMPKL